jgi:hypothetical protein
MKNIEGDIIATNRLINVIKGDSRSLFEEELNKERAINEDEVNGRERQWSSRVFMMIGVIVVMISFALMSIWYLLGAIRHLEGERDKLLILEKGEPTLPIPFPVNERIDLTEKVNVLCQELSAERPYVSSVIKEITHILPNNCFLNRLQIMPPAGNDTGKTLRLFIEGTLIEGPSFAAIDISNIVKSLEDSPLFQRVSIGYQDRSHLFHYRSIDFQLGFSLE